MGPITPQNREIEETRHHTRREQIISALFLLILLIAIPLFMTDGSGENLLTWENRTLQIHTPDGQVYRIPYDQIEGMTLLEDPDFGTCISGDSTKKLRYGVWENAFIGKYILCAYRSFDTIIQITTTEKTYWIGYESEETTRILYQSFLEHLKQ